LKLFASVQLSAVSCSIGGGFLSTRASSPRSRK